MPDISVMCSLPVDHETTLPALPAELTSGALVERAATSTILASLNRPDGNATCAPHLWAFSSGVTQAVVR
jgi:hypothetical protein